jgi:AbrB family looped-hinge helix DNA binding protein
VDDRTNQWSRGLLEAAHASTLTIMEKVKERRRRGASRISSKNQITIPAEALRSAGLAVGDRVVAHADGAGRVILERERDVIAEFAGALTGAYRPDELDELRSEWD